jgi:hypothetical protein
MYWSRDVDYQYLPSEVDFKARATVNTLVLLTWINERGISQEGIYNSTKHQRTSWEGLEIVIPISLEVRSESLQETVKNCITRISRHLFLTSISLSEGLSLAQISMPFHPSMGSFSSSALTKSLRPLNIPSSVSCSSRFRVLYG